MSHPVVHFEIGCRDGKKTQAFYSSLFAWDIAEAGPAAMIDAGGGPTGHITHLGHEPHHYTIFYVQVDDVQAYLDKAQKLGAKTLVPPTPFRPGLLRGCRIRQATRSVCGNRPASRTKHSSNGDNA
jgi:uncharacterized protein